MKDFLFIQNMGFTEWLVILVLVLLLFGGRKIPQLAKDLGQGIREFRSALLNPGQQTSQMIEQHQPEEPVQARAAKKQPAKKKATAKKARA